MAEIEKGSAVRSLAGRDKNRFFAVLSLQGDYAFIADGDLRRIASPKKKKLKHLAATNTRFFEETFISDKALHRAIKERFCSDDRQ